MKSITLTLFVLALSIIASMSISAGAGDRLLPMNRVIDPGPSHPDDTIVNRVHHTCLPSRRPARDILGLDREKSWSLPTKALDDFADTLHCLVMRFDFQFEETDDPNTTGFGVMNVGRIGPGDSAAYYDSVGHWADPPPHNAFYFHTHMKALRKYWETVSEGKITLTWDVYPGGYTWRQLDSAMAAPGAIDTNWIDSTYELPNAMSFYGRCGTDLPGNEGFRDIIAGLEKYFEHGLYVADSVTPEIAFGHYDSYFMFHAGSDRQNDIGFPATCNDLFTGYISYYDTIWVDNDSTGIVDAMMMPEYTSQDNRATAMNAVMAHEFGHQLGLVDLYRTDYFVTCLGDFALMDNNGFGTAIDFGWDVGRTFGAMPIYPSAWSRAYLGFVEVHDFREGTDIEVVAAEIQREGIKIARVPISENEYYLIENRLVDTDGRATAMLADSATSVFLGPHDAETREFTGEYDFLMPGSGMLIYLVDEAVAYMNNNAYTGDTVNNFNDNRLQWVVGDPNPSRKFITLIEADGVVDMSGYYQTYGDFRYGWEDDMFRDDRNSNFTPNTNPPTIDHTGNNSRIHIENIQRVLTNYGGRLKRNDSVMSFDLYVDKRVDGFPVRAGLSQLPLSPIADDLNGDGTVELIFAAGNHLNVATIDGGNFIHQVTECDPCLTYLDSAKATVHPGKLQPLPLYDTTFGPINAHPVTGDFGQDITYKYVAVASARGDSGMVKIVRPTDADNDGLADRAANTFTTIGNPLAMTFGADLYVLTDSGVVYHKPAQGTIPSIVADLDEQEYNGLVRYADGIIVLAGDSSIESASATSRLHFISPDDSVSFDLGVYYNFGPIMVDVDLDDDPEVVAFSPLGDGILVTVSMTGVSPSFAVLREDATGYPVTTNPVAADVDDDGYPEIVIGGPNSVYAFDRQLTIKTDFPKTASDRYINDNVLAAPIAADLHVGGCPELVFPTANGNIWSIGEDVSYGFPLSGGEMGLGSPMYFHDSTGGKLAYLGLDGWLYCWLVDVDSTRDYWSMYGADPAGTFLFDRSKLGAASVASDALPENKFYNYPNPATNGRTTIRYYLGRDASEVRLRIYDLSGRHQADLNGPTRGGLDNEVVWNCGDVTPGVYRCVIEADFSGSTETAFTDIAVIR